MLPLPITFLSFHLDCFVFDLPYLAIKLCLSNTIIRLIFQKIQETYNLKIFPFQFFFQMVFLCIHFEIKLVFLKTFSAESTTLHLQVL